MPSTEIIITLFQEDIIFGTNASLTYGMRSPYTEHAARGLPNSIPLEGEVRIIHDQDQQMLPHVV